jgi:hypothetical protein
MSRMFVQAFILALCVSNGAKGSVSLVIGR